MRFSSLSERIAEFLGEKKVHGGLTRSPSITSANQFLEMYSLLSMLPYESYDDETGLYFNRGSCGFVLEASPLTGASEETLVLLNSIIADTLPTGAYFQVLLWASPNIGDSLDVWASLRKEAKPIYQSLGQSRTTYLNQGAFQSLIPNDQYLLRDFRLMISVSLSFDHLSSDNIQAQLLSLRDELLQTFRSLSLHAKSMTAPRFINFIYDLVNVKKNTYSGTQPWDKQEFLNAAMVSPETSLQVTSHQLVLNEGEADIRCLAVSSYPTHWAQWGMGDLIGDVYRDALRIPCPFLISFAIHIPEKEKEERRALIKKVRADQQAASPIARFLPVVKKVQHDWQHVSQRLSAGDRLVEGCYQVILFNLAGKGDASETLVKNLYSSKGWKLEKPRYLQLQSFLSALPLIISEGLWEDLKRFGRVKTLLSSNAANLCPLQGEWKGMSIPRLLLTGRRGQLLAWDNFSNNEGNYNVAVVGKSGSGKSVFMQELMTSLLGTGGKVWVIDIGRSFAKTCELLEGEFIEFTPNTPVCINPFTFIQDFEEALSLLKPLFSRMVKPKEKTTDHEVALLEQAIKHAWSEKKNAATVTDVSMWLFHHTDVRAKDLGTMLFPYAKEGMYARFFEGPCTLNFQNPLVVLELEELKTKKDLQEVVLLVLMYHVTEVMYRGNRLQPLTCIIDEAWDLLGGDMSGEFVETGCRRARKYNGAFITGTQSVNDYYKTPAARAAFENSDWLCLLSQKPESIDELKERKRLHLDGHMERLLKSIKTLQGVYAEVLIYGPPGYAVGRLMLDPFSRVLYSSKGQEYAAVKQLQAQGLSLAEAISTVASRTS